MRNPENQPARKASHERTRTSLRFFGSIILASGVILTAIGMISFFSALGSFGPPQYFWCAFLGLPLIGGGSALLHFGFMGAVTRYAADEVVPVASDVVRQVVGGSKELLQDIVHPEGDARRRLEKLARLKDDGLITPTEYDAKRSDIIKSI
jgi:hypothetical protein